MAALERDIDDGVPTVGLKPSCVAVFRDELATICSRTTGSRSGCPCRLFLQRVPVPEDARFRLAEARADNSVLHGHRHRKALAGTAHDEPMPGKQFGFKLETSDTGCCGMAGSLGFENRKYDVSIQTGELVLRPTVRAAASGTLVVPESQPLPRPDRAGDRTAHNAYRRAAAAALRHAGRLAPARLRGDPVAVRRPHAIGSGTVNAAVAIAALATVAAARRRRHVER